MKLTVKDVQLLAESRGILPSELSNALFWLNQNADSGEQRRDFRSGPEVIRLLLTPPIAIDVTSV